MVKTLNLEIYGHHECHSFEAFARHESNEALIISIDGGGFDLQNNEMFELHTGAWHGKTDSTGKKEVNPILLDKQLSFGSIYNVTTRLLGFSTGYPKGSQAGSVMGMAAWGSVETLIYLKTTFCGRIPQLKTEEMKFLSRENIYEWRHIFEASKDDVN